MKKYAMSLQPITIEQPFSKWGIDVARPINPKSTKCHMYILIATDYFTKWPKVVALKKVDSKELIKFLKGKFTELCREYGIIMGKSSNYYPQGNGLEESTNKILIHMFKKNIEKNQRNWHLKLIDALWASRTTPKDSIGMSPYTLVYGKEAKISISLKLDALNFVVNTKDAEDSSPIQRRTGCRN
jgi:hypothetical protein